MKGRRGKKGLSAEDAELWGRVAKTARPLHQTGRPSLPEKVNKPKTKPEDTSGFVIKPFEIGQTANVRVVTSAKPGPSPIDRKIATRMKRGKLEPQARIDLHGMTQEQALPALNRFVTEAASRQHRLVLVITGKGRVRPDHGPIPERPGVLRRAVPQWLRNGMLRSLVLDVTEAHISHGGSGAFYVYLRRQRKG